MFKVTKEVNATQQGEWATIRSYWVELRVLRPDLGEEWVKGKKALSLILSRRVSKDALQKNFDWCFLTPFHPAGETTLSKPWQALAKYYRVKRTWRRSSVFIVKLLGIC